VGVVRHTLIAGLFVGLAVAWTYPLALHLSTHLPGAAIGDNATFLWNFWWMRAAIAQHVSYFHTDYLFAPPGTNLTLNTHTALTAFLGATLLGRLSPIAALNVTTIASLALNAFCAYLLAWRITRAGSASFIAGLIFGMSPYLGAHLNGHFNLTAAWTIPLFALAMLRAMERQSILDALGAGVVLGLTVYVDYYYVIYECVLAICLVIATRWRWSIRRDTTRRRTSALFAIAAIAAIDGAVIVAIAASGGFVTHLGSLVVDARDSFNLRQVFWILVAILVWLSYSTRISFQRRPARGAAIRAVVTLASAAIVAAPLVWQAWALIRDGDYATERYFWRNAPRGIDVASLILPSPFHFWWGHLGARAYAALGIDPIESIAWPGLASVALAVYAWRGRRGDPALARWTFIGAVFLVWAFGSHVHVAGLNTAFIMPAAVLQFIPIVSNARMPGRAMVVVYLALAMLAAFALGDIRARGRTIAVIALVAVVVAIDFWIAPFPITRVGCSRIYSTLRDRPEPGTVAELPLAMGDGLGSMTTINDRAALACQMIHERPIIGGFIARLSPRIVARYEADPLLASWLRLSGAQIAAGTLDAAHAAARLRADGIAFVLLNRSTASPQLREHVEHQLPLRLIAEQDGRALYLVR
jgi:hypothetical protein